MIRSGICLFDTLLLDTNADTISVTRFNETPWSFVSDIPRPLDKISLLNVLCARPGRRLFEPVWQLSMTILTGELKLTDDLDAQGSQKEP